MTQLRLACAAVALFAALPASAQNIDRAVKARNGQMAIISYNMGILGDMAKGNMDYDAALATGAVTNLAAAASMDVVTLWPEGSDNGAHPTTRAAPAIWSDMDGFKAKFAEMEAAAKGQLEAAGAGADGIGAVAGAIGGTCRGCHETYRGPRR